MAQVLLIVGHSETHPGARNSGPTMEPGDDTYEYQFNKPLVESVTKLLRQRHIDTGWDTYQEGVGSNVARWNEASELLIEFHCDAYNKIASGTEVLFCNGSTKGKAAARIMQDRLVMALGLPDRGIKSKMRSDRGGYILCGVNQVCLIPEPFFIDNDDDFERGRKRDLVTAYADAIEKIVKEVLPD